MCVQKQWANVRVGILNGFEWCISRRVKLYYSVSQQARQLLKLHLFIFQFGNNYQATCSVHAWLYARTFSAPVVFTPFVWNGLIVWTAATVTALHIHECVWVHTRSVWESRGLFSVRNGVKVFHMKIQIWTSEIIFSHGDNLWEYEQKFVYKQRFYNFNNHGNGSAVL